MSGALSSGNIENALTENRVRNLGGKGKRSDHYATEAPILIRLFSILRGVFGNSDLKLIL